MPPVRSQPARAQSVPPLPSLRPEALQPLPLLSSQMELEYQQVLRMVVVSQQEMCVIKTHVPLGEGVKAKPPHSNRTPGPSPPSSLRPAKAVSFASTVLPENERLLSPSPSDSSLSSLESLEPKAKIPKPPGEVGRLGRGGYNLEEHLKWPDNETRGLKETGQRVIHAAVKKYLDTTKSRTFQDLEAVKKAKRRFQQLEDYENCWPVLNLIHLCLKYLSSRHRQRHRRETSECATK
ncbi:hypothetical protein BKA83DRAFT_4129323 [Pisolithus microcarpus]|nr:hypothetical protein BKA83DRAFT_4129323 [Pisolithus microcarpus]